MHNDLYQYLKNEQSLAAIFGDRVYHMSLPQSVNTWPSLTFQQITRIEESPDWEAPNDEKMDSVTYQFEAIADSSETSVAAGEAFDTIFRNFRGTIGAIQVQAVELNNATQLEERTGDKLRRRVSMTYTITFNGA